MKICQELFQEIHFVWEYLSVSNPFRICVCLIVFRAFFVTFISLMVDSDMSVDSFLAFRFFPNPTRNEAHGVCDLLYSENFCAWCLCTTSLFGLRCQKLKIIVQLHRFLWPRILPGRQQMGNCRWALNVRWPNAGSRILRSMGTPCNTIKFPCSKLNNLKCDFIWRTVPDRFYRSYFWLVI